MLKPLPYQEPERIVELYTSPRKPACTTCGNVRSISTNSRNGRPTKPLRCGVLFRPDRRQGFGRSVPRRTGDGGNLHHPAVQPLLVPSSPRNRTNRAPTQVIVLTQSYWQSQYQESPEVLGKEVRIDEEAYKVIGVAPRQLEAFDARMKFITPLSWPAAAENPQGRYGVGLQLFGRLKPGVTAGQADAEAKVLESATSRGPPPLKAFVERSDDDDVGGVKEQRVSRRGRRHDVAGGALLR